MFLTKHPGRYDKLRAEGKLIAQDNFWYGTYLTDETTPFLSDQYHTFGYIDLTGAQAYRLSVTGYGVVYYRLRYAAFQGRYPTEPRCL